MKLEAVKELFEKWIVQQFGKAIIKPKLEEGFHNEDGYVNQDVNLVWVGFAAGVELGDKS